MDDKTKQSISEVIESLLRDKNAPDLLFMPWSEAERLYAKLGIKLEDIIQPAPEDDEDGRD